MTSENLTVSVAVVGRDRYILLFAGGQRMAALRQIGKWASDRTLNFTWADAARMAWDIKRGVDA